MLMIVLASMIQRASILMSTTLGNARILISSSAGSELRLNKISSTSSLDVLQATYNHGVCAASIANPTDRIN